MVFKEALSSLTVGLGFAVGYLILGILLRGNHWRVAHSNIYGQFAALPRPRHIEGQMHVSIGLQQVEVTLTGKLHNITASPITYQESFSWNEDSSMMQHFRQGLRGGLPYPVLTVLEHLVAQDQLWGCRFAFSGRLVTLLLWLSFSSGVVSALMGFLGESRPLSACLGITGGFLLAAIAAHDYLTPPSTIIVHFPKGHLAFTYGWCYIVLLYLGIFSILVSAISMVMFYLDCVTDYVRPLVSFIEKLDHYFQKHTTGLKATA